MPVFFLEREENMSKNNENEIQEIIKWWGAHSQKIINIESKNHSFDLKILKTRLPHLLGLHYMKEEPEKVTGIELMKEIYNKNLKNKDIFKSIKENQNDFILFKVKNRVFNFKNFMENLENAEIVKNTSQNMPEIKHFIILPHKNNKYFMLGVGNNGKEDYVGTFILDNDRYFKGSKIEKIEKIYRYKNSKSKDKIAFSFDNEKLESERNKILKKVRQDGWELKKLDIGYSNDKKIVTEAVKQDGMVLSIVNSNFQKDKETVLNAVKNNGLALKFASKDIKSNKETVMEAVKQNLSALQYAGDKLKNDKEFITQIIEKNPNEFVLQYVGENLRNNKDIALNSVKNNGMQLAFVSDDLKKDREVVLEAVKENGLALEFADENLKKDGQILFEAVIQNPEAVEFSNIGKKIFKVENQENDKEIKKNEKDFVK